jgi:hypothetical protein
MLSLRIAMAAPAFLLGMALMITFQVGAGLLLYGGPGMIPSLSILVATGAGALAVGLYPSHSAEDAQSPSAQGRPAESPSLETIRKRWLQLLVALVVAAVYAMAWSLGTGFGARAQSQAVGLAVLVALPALFVGQILQALVRTDGAAGPDAMLQVASSAVLGIGAGGLVLGQILFRMGVLPATTLLGALVLVSGAALAHGQNLDRLGPRPAPPGPPAPPGASEKAPEREEA